MMHDYSCDVTNDDGKHVFVAVTYGPSINEDNTKVQALLSKFPRLNDKELLATTDGVYTWLLYSSPDDETVKFICTKVISPFEIGTRHQALAHNSRHNVSRIYGGGELIKTGSKITFNLLSGTYSLPLVQFEYKKAVSKVIVEAFLKFFPSAIYDDDDSSYINKVKTVPNEFLKLYKEFGYIVRTFDTKAECITFNNKFNSLDFRIRHFKSLIDGGDTSSTIRMLYMEALEDMIDLLNSKKGGVRRTRRRRRH